MSPPAYGIRERAEQSVSVHMLQSVCRRLESAITDNEYRDVDEHRRMTTSVGLVGTMQYRPGRSKRRQSVSRSVGRVGESALSRLDTGSNGR